MTTDEIIKAVNKIVNGCESVKSADDCHEDAKKLASLIIRDCNSLLLKILKGEYIDRKR